MNTLNEPHESLLCTTAQAAALLAISRSSIYRMVDAGELPGIQIRGKLRIPRSSLDQLVSMRKAS